MEVFQHLSNTLRSNTDVLVKGELELLGQVLDDEAGPHRLLQVQSLGVITKLDSIDPNKVDLGLVVSGDGANGLDVFLVSLVRGVDEKVCEGLVAGSIDGVVLAVDFTDDGDGQVLDPLLDILDGSGGNGVRVGRLGFVELPVENDGGRCHTSGSDGSLVRGQTEEEVITVLLSSLAEFRSWGFRCRGNVRDGDDFVSFFELFKVGGGDWADGR